MAIFSTEIDICIIYGSNKQIKLSIFVTFSHRTVIKVIFLLFIG